MPCQFILLLLLSSHSLGDVSMRLGRKKIPNTHLEEVNSLPNRQDRSSVFSECHL